MKLAICLLLLLKIGNVYGQPINNGVVYFPESFIDAGEIPEKGYHTFSFPFQNISSKAITIYSIRESSPCVVGNSKAFSTPVLPGTWDTIKAEYNTLGRPGYFTKTLSVDIKGDSAACVLMIKGNVQPYPFNKISISYYPSKDTVKRAWDGHLYLDRSLKNGTILLFRNLDSIPVNLELLDNYGEKVDLYGAFFCDVSADSNEGKVTSVTKEKRRNRYLLNPQKAVFIRLLPHLKEIIGNGNFFKIGINNDFISINTLYE